MRINGRFASASTRGDGRKADGPSSLERHDMQELKALGTSELVLGHRYEQGGHAYWARFLAGVVAQDLPHERSVRWDTTAVDLAAVIEHATHSSRDSSSAAALLELDDCIAAVR